MASRIPSPDDGAARVCAVQYSTGARGNSGATARSPPPDCRAQQHMSGFPGSAHAERASKVALLCLCALWAAPSFARTPLDLKDLRGRVVYVDFWASWCTPCRESFPWMRALESTYGRQGLSVIAVDLDHDRADAQRFLRAFRPNFEVIFDPAGTLAERFNVIGMPTSVLIDRQGKIRYVHVGFLLKQRAEYERQVRELLAQK